MSNLPLNQFPTGSRVTIACLRAGCGARSRLYAMGLTPGTKVMITGNNGCGPCRMKVRESELVLGSGLASKILATEED